MTHLTEHKILQDYIQSHGMRHSDQRSVILDIFLDNGRHVTADELTDIIQADRPEMGVATVYRAMHLFCDAGLATELQLDDGKVRYEPLVGVKHHDHLICTECGKCVEICSSEIELLQQEIAEKHGFTLNRHRHILYGICETCS